MRGNPKERIRGQVQTLFDVGSAAALTDGQLLERFATRRDEGSEVAFAALVERHGPMVLRACRGILGDDHEAMDAFQATFLVLARKGSTLWVRDSLSPWLHRVACRAAGRARRTRTRQRELERRAAEMVRPRDQGDDHAALAALLHEEVDRLPERFRAAVVLCDLEGRTCEEAARHIGCPVGTVASRLARGRQRLRDRLNRRGLAAVPVVWQLPRVPIPSDLVDATAVAASRFASIQAVSHGTAATLALGVLRTMSITRWCKAASVLLVLFASATGVVSLAGRDESEPHAPPEKPALTSLPEEAVATKVKPGALRVVVKERGSLESANTPEVFSKIEGQTTIRSILPEGTRVRKGDLVAELDSAFLKDRLVTQKGELDAARLALETARLDREAAELAVKEYTEGIYRVELQRVTNEVAEARAAVDATGERLKRTRLVRDRLDSLLIGQRPTASADLVAALDLRDRFAAAEQDLARQRGALELAETRRDTLKNLTYGKNFKLLNVQVAKARSVEAAGERAWEVECAKQARLERQIESCKLLAPGDGPVVYAYDGGPSPDGHPLIEEGAVVRESQKIFSVPDLSRMKVNTKVLEAIVHQIRPGLRAQIRVDAFPEDMLLTGTVDDVAPRPDQRRSPFSEVKVYTTNVSIDGTPTKLRPGMTAEVEILVTALDNALTVPVSSVVYFARKNHVAVKTPDGRVDWRVVRLGISDQKVVEVQKGLEAGEVVVLDPLPLMSEEQKRLMPDAPKSKGSPQGKRPKE